MRSSLRQLGGGRWRRQESPGFTLLEVLVVIAVVAVLAAITLSISGGAREKAAQDRARSELAVLSTALERYRSVYGSYPQDEQDPEGLLLALSGTRTPSGATDDRAPFITLAGLVLNATADAIVDPWGQPYGYVPFRSGARQGFRLYSMGPDGKDLPPTKSGGVDESAKDNLDNIYGHL